jgi:hypothetical protein
MATGFDLARRGRVRDWLRGDAPASKGAQAFMFVSAMLCGAALSGLLFVGVWRHTAGEAASSKAAQRSDHRALETSRQAVTALAVKLAHEQALLARTARARAATAATLARARDALTQAQAALAHSQTALTRTKTADAAKLDAANARTANLIDQASTLARTTATLRSELTALEGYAQNPGPTGVDPGYLANQVRYLEASAAAAASAASDLARRSSG